MASRLAQLVLGADTADVNTVFVVDREQFTGLYPGGAGAIDSIVGNLDDLAGLGYPAVVLQVDAVPEVDTAMDAWNATRAPPRSRTTPSARSALSSTTSGARTRP